MIPTDTPPLVAHLVSTLLHELAEGGFADLQIDTLYRLSRARLRALRVEAKPADCLTALDAALETMSQEGMVTQDTQRALWTSVAPAGPAGVPGKLEELPTAGEGELRATIEVLLDGLQRCGEAARTLSVEGLQQHVERIAYPSPLSLEHPDVELDRLRARVDDIGAAVELLRDMAGRPSPPPELTADRVREWLAQNGPVLMPPRLVRGAVQWPGPYGKPRAYVRPDEHTGLFWVAEGERDHEAGEGRGRSWGEAARVAMAQIEALGVHAPPVTDWPLAVGTARAVCGSCGPIEVDVEALPDACPQCGAGGAGELDEDA